MKRLASHLMVLGWVLSVSVSLQASDWTMINPIPTGEDLTGIWGTSPNNVYAIGSNSTLIQWNGYFWSKLDLPLANHRLIDIWGFDAEDFYILSATSIFHWNGQSWTTVDCPYIFTPAAIWGPDPQKIYIAGRLDYPGGPERMQIYRFENSDWTLEFSLEVGGGGFFSAIYGYDSSSVFIGGFNQTAIIVRWDGATWRSEYPAVDGSIRDLYGFSSDNVYAIADTAVLHWNGSSWSVFHESVDGAFLKIWGSNPNDLYVMTDNEIIHWDGSTWTTWLSLDVSLYIRDVWYTGQTKIFVAGLSGTLARCDSFGWEMMFKDISRDDGRTDYLLDVSYGPGTDIFSLSDKGNIYVWDGTEFVVNASGMDASRSFLAFSSNNICIAGENGRIVQWNGAQWTTMTTGVTENINKLWGLSDQSIFAAGSQGLMLHYDGSAWNKMEAGTGDLFSVWGFSNTDVYAGGHDAILHYDGSSWSQMPGDFSFNTDIMSIWGSSTSNLYAGCGNLIPSVMHWDGAAWNRVFKPDSSQYSSAFVSICGFSENDIYFAGCHMLAHWDGVAWSEIAAPNVFIESMKGIDASTLLIAGQNDLAFWRPVPEGSGIEIELPSQLFHPGDEFYVKAHLNNSDLAVLDAHLYIILNVGEDYWFWDDWTYYHSPDQTNIDFRTQDVLQGSSVIDVIPSLVWPDTGSLAMDGMFFYGGILDSTDSVLIGDFDAVEWGFEP